jgi:hypothetical protein
MRVAFVKFFLTLCPQELIFGERGHSPVRKKQNLIV